MAPSQGSGYIRMQTNWQAWWRHRVSSNLKPKVLEREATGDSCTEGTAATLCT